MDYKVKKQLKGIRFKRVFRLLERLSRFQIVWQVCEHFFFPQALKCSLTPHLRDGQGQARKNTTQRVEIFLKHAGGKP
jgi:hypothetical protein